MGINTGLMLQDLSIQKQNYAIEVLSINDETKILQKQHNDITATHQSQTVTHFWVASRHAGFEKHCPKSHLIDCAMSHICSHSNGEYPF